MRQVLVPVLLLAAVALSSSNVLPIGRLDSVAINSQHDNTLRNRYTKPNNNIFYTLAVTPENNRLISKLPKYLARDRTGERFNDVRDEEDNYDVEGFRKEQWHNYPRQLDRLHEYLTHYHNGDIKRNPDLDDPGIEYYDSESKEKPFGDTSTNEYLPDSNDNIYDSVIVATNPLFILKLHLACLSNRLKNTQSTNFGQKSFQTQLNNGKETNGVEENLFTNEINPVAKVKREGVTSQETGNSDENTPGKKKTKRLFSLWSRLQSLSHKGHELPHRRHLAYYGFPEAGGDGGGSPGLTAETRAMIRPPGSPLRWG